MIVRDGPTGSDLLHVKFHKHQDIKSFPLIEIFSATYDYEESQSEQRFVLVTNDKGEKLVLNTSQLMELIWKAGLKEYGELQDVVIQPAGMPTTTEVFAFMERY